ncbi:30S ribosome-binding factor RbfA [Saccharospirillum salsuginis]|uniref:Ribosome-binding factor A n=1 Tax=Saccharospirillum salsuginis TaxID=418750 RepID=A0A918N685_9GAMM|nr:30S ribosome-binding factor RbfA [Saccharospirillum salsuginis]GGX44823.1 ribosome-binding factor A [Saccharospirillum salsuginis]
MAKENSRIRRIADQIQRDLSVLIQQEVKDPRLGMVTINAVKVSRDLSYADVYFTCMVFGDDADAEQARREQEKLLNKASGFLRSMLAQALKLRVMPQLRFHYDEVIESGARLSGLIDEALRQDKSRHRGDE